MILKKKIVTLMVTVHVYTVMYIPGYNDLHFTALHVHCTSGSVAAAQKSCQDWIKQTIVFIVDLFYCLVSIVFRSIVFIQLIFWELLHDPVLLLYIVS